MKIKVTEILPGDAVVLADGIKKTAAGACAVGLEGPIEVMWRDGSTLSTFSRDAEIQVVARLHMAVPSEMDVVPFNTDVSHVTSDLPLITTIDIGLALRGLRDLLADFADRSFRKGVEEQPK